MVTSDRTTEYNEESPAPAGGPAYLRPVRGLPRGPAIRIEETSILGRDEDVDVRLPVDGVSRRHARIVHTPGSGFALVDLGSRNGTFLNGRRIEMAALREGDEIRMGPAVLEFGLQSTEPASQAAPAGSERGPESLKISPRELEVARLVAEGLTNAKIGRQLGISGGTVGRHLANIYQRLGIHSRAALAKLVTELE